MRNTSCNDTSSGRLEALIASKADVDTRRPMVMGKPEELQNRKEKGGANIRYLMLEVLGGSISVEVFAHMMKDFLGLILHFDFLI